MTTHPRTRTLVGGLTTLGVAALMTLLASASSPKFFDDDPIRFQPDTQDASRMKPSETSLFVDLAYNILKGSDVTGSGRALNVNTVDEVPDSSWFTNRAGYRPITVEDVTNGPNTDRGPASGIWTITASKSDGVTPGFTVTDANGERWFLKFDPPGYRGMATGTEVTVTKLMWALGYNVPENHVAYMRRDQLVIGDGATLTPVGGKRRAMRLNDIDKLLGRASREPDGSYRVVASKALEGTPVGRVRFMGTRSDDPNDVIAHEDRRELRGYGVFAAWLNHVDAKAINSLDTLVTENGRSFVRHNIIDFGSSLGSGGVAPADYWGGAEYLLEPARLGKQLLSFGFSYPKWHTTRFYEAPSIGRLPADNAGFNPDLWKPRVPNQAFLHARADDKFWAAQKLLTINTDLIRAAVRSGEFGDPASEAFLVRALAERRDAIGRAYLTGVNPIVNPSLSDSGTLTFANAAVDADFAKAPAAYRGVWSTFDNTTQTSERLGETLGRSTSLEAPTSLPTADGSFIKVELSAIGSPHPSWEVPMNVFFRLRHGSWQLVGLERMPAH